MRPNRLLPLPLLLAACAPNPVPTWPGPSVSDDDDAADDDDAVGDDDDDTTLPPDPVLTRRSCEVVLAVTPPGSPGSLQVAGSFNGWTPADMAPGEDGAWTASLGELAPGQYAYKLLPNGEWESSPPPDTPLHWDGGIENRNLVVGDCGVPLLQLVSIDSGSRRVRATVQFATAEDGEPLDPDTLVVTLGGEPVDAEVDVAEGVIRLSVSNLPDGKHSLRVEAADAAGRAAEHALWVPVWVEPEPFAWSDGAVYFAMVDRFRDGDGSGTAGTPWTEPIADWRGGDYLGLLDALREGWFEQLGVRTIWLSGVLESADGGWIGADGVHHFAGYHGYWPVSSAAIEPRFGDAGGTAEERLHEVIEEAHARGIRVLFDVVLNHIHEHHDLRGERPEWFGSGCVCGTDGCGWEERAVDCWFMPYLPDLDYKNHAIVERMVADTVALVERFDVDALRIDAAKHMDHVILRNLRARLGRDEARGAAPIWLVGETFTGGDGRGLIMDYVSPWELHGQFDFPLFWAARSAFLGGSLQGLDSAVQASANAYGEHLHLMSPFLGNHDVSRFATDLAGNAVGPWSHTEDLLAGGGEEVTQGWMIERIARALAFVLTQPGVPLIYYGDEIGLAGDGDPDNRRRMTFPPYLSANQEALLDRVRALGQARAGSRALRRGELRTLWVDDSFWVYARDAGGGEVAVVAINNGDGPRSEDVDFGGLGLEGAVLRSAAGEEGSVSVSAGGATVSLGAGAYAVFTP